MPNLEMVYDVKDIKNQENATSIKNAVKALEGINNVEVDVNGQKVIVGYTPGIITVQSIKETIEDEGFQVI